METRPGDPADEHVRSLCAELVPGGSPISVTPTPPHDAPFNDCVRLVDAAVQSGGGERVDGWAIWERPRILVEAEFHSVWNTPDGSLRDLSPLPSGIESRLFLPDPGLVYDGRQINNVRRAIDSHPSLTRLIAAYDAHFEVLNRGERAFQHGAVSIPSDEIRPVVARMVAAEREVAARLTTTTRRRKLGRNERCPCGSGLKYKKCHGR